MTTSIPKISVVIITFNQEELIRRSLDSVLSQIEYIHEIIVSDDCSTDDTWNVLEGYKKRFPIVIRPYRHKTNQGIFGNIESTWGKTSGDLVHLMAGDDAVCPEFFKKAIEFINDNSIDPFNGSYCIYTDSKAINKEGHEKILSNKLVAQGYNPVSLKIRGLIGSIRGILYSKELFSSFKSPKYNVGLCTDGLYDIQVQLNSDRNYYIPYVGGIYYTGLGVASKSDKDEGHKSLMKLYQILYKDLELSMKDKYYLLYKIETFKFLLSPNINFIFKGLILYIRGASFKYGLELKKTLKLLIKIPLELIKAIKI